MCQVEIKMDDYDIACKKLFKMWTNSLDFLVKYQDSNNKYVA